MANRTILKSMSFKLAVYCFALIAAAQAAQIMLTVWLGEINLFAQIAIGLGFAITAAVGFFSLSSAALSHLNDLVRLIGQLAKGDLSNRALWSPAPNTVSPSSAVNQKVEQKANELSQQFRADCTLDTSKLQTIGSMTIPTFMCGQRVINNDHSWVDQLATDSGTVATVFVRRVEDFVRMSTSLKKADGSRAIGTMLDRTRPAYKNLINGESFSGVAQLFGKYYLSRYTPLKSPQGYIVGALFVGVEFDPNPLPNDDILAIGAGMNQITKEFGEFISAISIAAEAVASAASELAGKTEQGASQACQQSMAAMASASAINEMSSSIEHVASQARNAEAIAIETTGICDHGEHVVAEASREIGQIADSVTSLSTVIESLRTRSEDVNGIVKVIRGIADQTNLLALNAAIEAARAGESGRGFAVVADEVRKLAERTGMATQEISTMIAKNQSEIDNAVENMKAGQIQVAQGVRTANEASTSLGSIKSSSHRIEETIREINAATQLQEKSSSDITHHVEQITAITQGASTNMIALASAAGTLEQMASNLQNMAGRFRV